MCRGGRVFAGSGRRGRVASWSRRGRWLQGAGIRGRGWGPPSALSLPESPGASEPLLLRVHTERAHSWSCPALWRDSYKRPIAPKSTLILAQARATRLAATSHPFPRPPRSAGPELGADAVLALQKRPRSAGSGGWPGPPHAGQLAAQGRVEEGRPGGWGTGNRNPSPGGLGETPKRGGRQPGQGRAFCQQEQHAQGRGCGKSGLGARGAKGEGSMGV